MRDLHAVITYSHAPANNCTIIDCLIEIKDKEKVLRSGVFQYEPSRGNFTRMYEEKAKEWLKEVDSFLGKLPVGNVIRARDVFVECMPRPSVGVEKKGEKI